MLVHKERSQIETVYLMGAKTHDELKAEMSKWLRRGYELIGEHEIGYGNDNHTQHNARLQKIITG